MHSHARKLDVRYPTDRMLAQLHAETLTAGTYFANHAPSLLPGPAVYMHDPVNPSHCCSLGSVSGRPSTDLQSTLHILFSGRFKG